jgi:hypothetical protein
MLASVAAHCGLNGPATGGPLERTAACSVPAFRDRMPLSLTLQFHMQRSESGLRTLQRMVEEGLDAAPQRKHSSNSARQMFSMVGPKQSDFLARSEPPKDRAKDSLRLLEDRGEDATAQGRKSLVNPNPKKGPLLRKPSPRSSRPWGCRKILLSGRRAKMPSGGCG